MKWRRRFLHYLPLAIGLVLVLGIAGLAYHYRSLLDKPVQVRRQVQQVTVIPPPPPAPPPPEAIPQQLPKEETVPPPEPAPKPEPEPETPGQPSAEDTLGLDADGGAGSDGFGLVGRRGGRGLIGGGGGGNALIWYGQQAGRVLETELRPLLVGSAARDSAYTVTVDLWIAADGRLSRAEMTGGSGNGAVDAALRSALPKLRLTLPGPPPESLPQPLRLKLRSGVR